MGRAGALGTAPPWHGSLADCGRRRTEATYAKRPGLVPREKTAARPGRTAARQGLNLGPEVEILEVVGHFAHEHAA
jgi:hypothetical protein